MVVRDGKTESHTWLESARRSKHSDSRRLKGVVGRESKSSMVLTTLIGSIWRSIDNIVPDKNIGFVRSGCDVGNWTGFEVFVLTSELKKKKKELVL